jgi:ABC-type uncharacterized transport system permease subunit
LNWEWAGRVGVLCFVASYGVGLAYEIARLLWPRLSPWLTVLATSAGVVAQSAFLLYRGYTQGRIPIATSFDSLMVLGWITAMASVVLGWSGRRQNIALFLLPVSIGFAIFASLLFDRTIMGDQGTRILGTIHGVLLLVGSAATAVAMVASTMYLVKSRQLRTGAFFHRLKLPSLEWLERLSSHSLLAAWPLLSVGIGLGFSMQTLSWADPKVILTILGWLALSLLAQYRLGPSHRGARSAWATLVAGSLMLLAVLGDPIWGTHHQLMRGAMP